MNALRVLAAAALVTVAGCASPPAPSPEPPPPPSGGYASLGLADLPAAPRRDPPKTLSASDSRCLASLLEIAAAFVNCR